MSAVHDFGSADQDQLQFTIQGQTYTASGRGSSFMRAMETSALQAEAQKLDGEARALKFTQAIADYLEYRLTDDSWARFSAAMNSDDPDVYIDVAQAMEVYRWLLAQASNRPTEEPGGSSTSSETDGASSTPDTPPTQESIPET